MGAPTEAVACGPAQLRPHWHGIFTALTGGNDGHAMVVTSTLHIALHALEDASFPNIRLT